MVQHWRTWNLVVLFDFGALQSLLQLVKPNSQWNVWFQCLWKQKLGWFSLKANILHFAFYHAVPEIWHVNPSRCLQKLSFDGSFRESLCLGIPHYSQMYHKHVDLLPTWLISLQFGGTNVVFILVGSRTPPSDGPVWTRDDNRISLMANVVVLQEVIRFSSRVRCYELFMQFLHTL